MKTISTEQLTQMFALADFRELATFGAISDETVLLLLNQGRVIQLEPGEELYHTGGSVREFYVILGGMIALFHHYQGKPAMTRKFCPGEQIGFVGMIALHDRKGTAVAEQVSHVLEVSVEQFFELQHSAPQDFGLLTLNLAREMARSVATLGDRIAELQARSLS